MYDLGSHFHIDVNKGKTPTSCVFRGNYYRISILSDSLIRFEYNLKGVFNDYPTLFAFNRSFGEPKVTVTEDNQNIVIKSSKFILEYARNKGLSKSERMEMLRVANDKIYTKKLI